MLCKQYLPNAISVADIMPQAWLPAYCSFRVEFLPRAKHEDVINTILFFSLKFIQVRHTQKQFEGLLFTITMPVSDNMTHQCADWVTVQQICSFLGLGAF